MIALAFLPATFFVGCIAYAIAHDLSRIAQHCRQHGDGERVRGEDQSHNGGNR